PPGRPPESRAGGRVAWLFLCPPDPPPARRELAAWRRRPSDRDCVLDFPLSGALPAVDGKTPVFWALHDRGLDTVRQFLKSLSVELAGHKRDIHLLVLQYAGIETLRQL